MGDLRIGRMPVLVPLILAREKLTRGTRPREVGGEPAVMDELQGVEEYDAIGAGVERGVHQFNALALSRLLPEGGTLLDLGCGSGRLLARLARGRPDVRAIGLDLSEPMLDTGRALLEREGLSDRVELRRRDITAFDPEISEEVDAVSCNFALHHLPDEETARRCLEAIARARASTGCAVWIFDFARLSNPKSYPTFASMVNWPGPVVHNDAIASEQAAFTFEEMVRLLDEVGLDELENRRSQPLGETQVHFVAGSMSGEDGLWQGDHVPRDVRLLTRMALHSFPRSLTRDA